MTVLLGTQRNSPLAVLYLFDFGNSILFTCMHPHIGHWDNSLSCFHTFNLMHTLWGRYYSLHFTRNKCWSHQCAKCFCALYHRMFSATVGRGHCQHLHITDELRVGSRCEDAHWNSKCRAGKETQYSCHCFCYAMIY